MRTDELTPATPDAAAARKQRPVATGVIDYFPDALLDVAYLSWKGNQQHNPGTPLHWDRTKSTDEADALMRHFIQRGTVDTDGVRHSAKVAWRALALLQKEIEAARTQSNDAAVRKAFEGSLQKGGLIQTAAPILRAKDYIKAVPRTDSRGPDGFSADEPICVLTEEQL